MGQRANHLPTIPPRISVVLSFWNEEDVLPELIGRLREVLANERKQGRIRSHELVFVNDASTDRSLDILLAASEVADDIHILSMSRNFGVSPCVLAGMEHSSGELVVYMDADLQDPPEVISDLLVRRDNDPTVDVIHTVRRTRAGESRIKMAITHVGYRILRWVSSVNIRANAGDFKLLSRRVVKQLVRLHEKKPFVRGLVTWVGFKQVEHIYDRDARFAGETKFAVYSPRVIRNFLESALISFSDIPLQLSMALGFLTSTASFLLLIYILIEKHLGHNIPGWTALMTAILFLGGLQMMLIGTLGLYVSAIYAESKGRPNYIIDRKIGFDSESQSHPGDRKRRRMKAGSKISQRSG